MRLQKRLDPVGRLRALANPVIDAFEVDAQILLRLLAERIEKSQSLDVPPVPTIPAVGDDEVIKRPLFRARARKTNTNHDNSAKNSVAGRHAHARDVPSNRRIVRIPAEM